MGSCFTTQVHRREVASNDPKAKKRDSPLWKGICKTQQWLMEGKLGQQVIEFRQGTYLGDYDRYYCGAFAQKDGKLYHNCKSLGLGLVFSLVAYGNINEAGFS